MRMVIPYQTTKFRYTIKFATLILGPTTKVNISGYTVLEWHPHIT